MRSEHRGFDDATEVREMPHGRADVIDIEGGQVMRLTLQPGWRWSEHVKPIAGTDMCEAPHFQYSVSGTIHVVMADGSEFDVGPERSATSHRDMTRGSWATSRSLPSIGVGRTSGRHPPDAPVCPSSHSSMVLSAIVMRLDSVGFARNNAGSNSVISNSDFRARFGATRQR
jgi:hypothetical protein